MTENIDEKYTRADRDLLIRVDTKLDSVIRTVDELKHNLVSRVENLERWQAWTKGIFAIIGVVVTLVVYIYLKDLTHIEELISKHIEQTQ
jgi:hypothetical protein